MIGGNESWRARREASQCPHVLCVCRFHKVNIPIPPGFSHDGQELTGDEFRGFINTETPPKETPPPRPPPALSQIPAHKQTLGCKNGISLGLHMRYARTTTVQRIAAHTRMFVKRLERFEGCYCDQISAV